VPVHVRCAVRTRLKTCAPGQAAAAGASSALRADSLGLPAWLRSSHSCHWISVTGAALLFGTEAPFDG
jgi:hypothetical protein